MRQRPGVHDDQRRMDDRSHRGGGPLALVQNGDIIRIDAVAERIEVALEEVELARRRAAWVPPVARRLTGVLQKYAAVVGAAYLGAVTHAGTSAE